MSRAKSFAQEILEGLEKEDPSAIWLLKDILRTYIALQEEEIASSEDTENEGDEENEGDDGEESCTDEDEEYTQKRGVHFEKEKKRKVYK